MPGSRDSKCERVRASHKYARCTWQGLKMREGEGQSQVCQVHVAGTQNARGRGPVSLPGGRDSKCERVRASHKYARCTWQGLKMREGEGQSQVCQVAGTQNARG